MSGVIVIDECPSIFDTTARSTPAASSSDARPCRRSWTRIGRIPADFTSSPKVFVTCSGASGFPSVALAVDLHDLLTYDEDAPGRVDV